MTVEAAKLVLTPLLVIAVTLISRRWGHLVGGMVGGLPLISGPVSVFLAVEQGPGFAARAAAGATLGMVSMGAFCAGYARAAARATWPGSMAAGLAAFAASTALLSRLDLPLAPAFVVACLGLGAALALVPRRGATAAPATAPRWDLALRAVAATVVVWVVTMLAPLLGPALSGLVSPIPVVAILLATFAQRQHGPTAAAGVLRGMIIGSFTFPVFFAVVGLGLPRWGLVATYVLATVAAVGSNVLLCLAGGRRIGRPRAGVAASQGTASGSAQPR